MSMTFDTSELRGLNRTIEELGKLPKKCVSAGARKGAQYLRKEIKSAAPRGRTGELRKGMKIQGEKSSRGKVKKVYQVVFDPAKNDVFVKTSKAGKRAYYPASQEYGYATRSGGHVEGKRFMRDTAEANASQVNNEMLQGLKTSIDKEWAKQRKG